MPDKDELTLRVRGAAYGGWKSVVVRRSIESLSGVFSVSVSELWPGQPSKRVIRPRDPVSVAIGDDVVITGYVDQVETSLSAEGHSVTITGRDKAADLIDSAPDLPPFEWHGLTVLELAQLLARPFGVQVRSDVGAGRMIPKVGLGPGGSAWHVIEERCRYEGFLPVSDGAGGILLTRASDARVSAAIVEGENLLAGELSLDFTDRFSEYIVKGQTQGSDATYGENAAELEGTATDLEIDRYRPLVVISYTAADTQHCMDRAKWEATVRAGRSTRASVTVQGWRTLDGGLWPVNALVPLRSPTLGIDRELLISEVTYRLDEGGAITQLSLIRPEAFALLQLPEVPEDSGFGYEGSAG